MPNPEDNQVFLTEITIFEYLKNRNQVMCIFMPKKAYKIYSEFTQTISVEDKMKILRMWGRGCSSAAQVHAWKTQHPEFDSWYRKAKQNKI